MHEFMRWKRGSLTRREFFGRSGLAGAMAAVGASALGPQRAWAQEIGGIVTLTTWPNYHDPATFEAFTAATGCRVRVRTFGSNEAVMAEMRAGRADWSLFVPTNYTLSTYAGFKLIEPLDLGLVPNYHHLSEKPRFTYEGMIAGRTYALPKNWGTTGFALDTSAISARPETWKGFFETAMAEGSGHTIVQDYQLTAIGSAMVALGYSFNSIAPDELAEAEKLLLAVKPHLLAITSDYQPAMRAGEAWLAMCWTNDGAQLHAFRPEIAYVIGADGGELWTDFYAIPSAAPNRTAGYALLNFLMDPEVAAVEHLYNGSPTTDERVEALLPQEIIGNPIVYPDEVALSALEFGVATTFTDPGRAQVMARFTSR